MFFSPPEAQPAGYDAAAGGAPPAALTFTGLPSSLAETAQQIALSMQPDLAKLSAASIKAAAMLPPASSMVRSVIRSRVYRSGLA